MCDSCRSIRIQTQIKNPEALVKACEKGKIHCTFYNDARTSANLRWQEGGFAEVNLQRGEIVIREDGNRLPETAVDELLRSYSYEETLIEAAPLHGVVLSESVEQDGTIVTLLEVDGPGVEEQQQQLLGV